MHLSIFNPDHDLALANFSSTYTPPTSARKMMEDMETLPVWYAESPHVAVSDKKYDVHVAAITEKLCIRHNLIPFSEMAQHRIRHIEPWGWNPAIRKKFLDAGVTASILPTLSEIEQRKEYSGRRHAVAILRFLQEEEPSFCGESHYFNNITALIAYLSKENRDYVLKMPYSGSGKGLIWIKGEITSKQADWCRRVVTQQGGVVAEPVLDRIQDFAMEFLMRNGTVEFVGYSLFDTSASGAYLGNRLLRDEDIEKVLSQYIDRTILHWLQQTLKERLVSQFPLYNGYLGVDMMICKEKNNRFRVQPCVEINMRMNMGMVAHIFRKRCMHETKSGIFRVTYFNKEHQAIKNHHAMLRNYPLAIHQSKIFSGYVPLTAVNENTRYVAYAIVADF